MRIKLWKLPEKWVSEEVDIFDKEEKYSATAKMAEEKIENQKKDEEGQIISDDDDLNGWCNWDF